MPSAKILLRATEELQQGRRSELLSTLNKAKLVRELSFLSVQLEINEHTTEEVYAACLQAAKDLTSQIDSILDKPTILATPPPPARSFPSVGMLDPIMAPGAHLQGLHATLPGAGDAMQYGTMNWGLLTDWNMLEGWE